jgi:hypothetical protein
MIGRINRTPDRCPQKTGWFPTDAGPKSRGPRVFAADRGGVFVMETYCKIASAAKRFRSLESADN